MASWDEFVKDRLPTAAHVVYAVDEDGMPILDPKLETALAAVGARVTRGSVVDAIASPDLIILTHEMATGANVRAAFEAASGYARDLPVVVTVGSDRPSEMTMPSGSGLDTTFFPPLGGVTYFTVSRRDFDPLKELQDAFEVYYAWAKTGRRSPVPVFLFERPRADENFRALATRAPLDPSAIDPFAVVVARDMFQDPDDASRARELMGRIFRDELPRELISSSMEPEDDLSDLFLGSEAADEQWTDETPENEDVPSRELVERFDTPLPSEVEIAPRVSYYEFDTRIVDEKDPVTGEEYRVEERDNCRPVTSDTLRATADLDPETWTARTGGVPLVDPAAIARYEADPKALGTELEKVRDGERHFERVILDQTRHWSGMFGHAPAASVYPLSENLGRAFANVEIDEESGEVSLLRPISKGEFLTIDYGEEFFGESAYPHFALGEIESEPESKDEEIEILDVMMSHAWDAAEAMRLSMDIGFVQQAANVLLVTDEDLTGLAFGFCADVVATRNEKNNRDARMSIFERIEKAKAKVLKDLVKKGTVDAPVDPKEAEMQPLLRQIKESIIKSKNPEDLWKAAKHEWDLLNDYMEGIQDADPVLHAELNLLMGAVDDEGARVMHPRYNAMIALREPRFGVDFVSPYTFDAILKAAQTFKRLQLEEWRTLVRDSGLDPDKKVGWAEAKRFAIDRDAFIASRTNPVERESLRKFVDFWQGYPEFTVVDPESHARELVFSGEELLMIREEEGRQNLERKRKLEETKKLEKEQEMREEREIEDRQSARKAQDEERDRRRDVERVEFDRLGRLMLERLAGRGESFDTADYGVVTELIVHLEDRYEHLIKKWSKPQRARWDKWRALAKDAYERTAENEYKTTGKFPRFVETALVVLKEFEAYENRKHPHRMRETLARLGMEPTLEKKRKKTKKGTGIKKSVSPAKASSPVKSVKRPDPSPSSYTSASVFGAVSALVRRARGDAVFFFYGTRSEGFVEQFEEVFASSTVLHKPGLGGEGGVVSPDVVHDVVTHFFVLYEGDEDARRWYERMPRGTSWPLLVATEEMQRRVDPQARLVDESSFEMMVGEKKEMFAMYRRREIVALD